MAENLNVTDKHIRNLEYGRYGVSVELLVEMSELFGVSLDYLVLGRQQSGDRLRSQLHSLMLLLADIDKNL